MRRTLSLLVLFALSPIFPVISAYASSSSGRAVVFPAGTEHLATKGFVLATIMLLLLIGLPITVLVWRRNQ